MKPIIYLYNYIYKDNNSADVSVTLYRNTPTSGKNYKGNKIT